MKMKSVFCLIIFLSAFSIISAQETGSYVDVKQTNEEIAHLEWENNHHETVISESQERKSFLENRIRISDSRLSVIEENLAFTNETLIELNALNRETRDRATKRKLQENRSDLMDIIWLLNKEKDQLTEQSSEDRWEVEFLTNDIARRQTVVEENKADIETKKRAVSDTESKINEISSKLDSIVNRIDGFREEVTTNPAP